MLPAWLLREGIPVSRSKTRSCSCLFEKKEKASTAVISLQDRLLEDLDHESFRTDSETSRMNLRPIELHFLVKHLLFKSPRATVQFQGHLKSLLGEVPGREWSPIAHPLQGIANIHVRRRHAFMDAVARALELIPLDEDAIQKATVAGMLRYPTERERSRR